MNTVSIPVISASQLSSTDVPEAIVCTFMQLLMYYAYTVSETHAAGQLVTLKFQICVSACLFQRFFIWCSQAVSGSEKKKRKKHIVPLTTMASLQ